MDKNKIIQSYVFKDGKRYFVSTANRESDFGAYSETIVWEWNTVDKERGKLLTIVPGNENSADEHFLICGKILDGVSPEELWK